MPRTPLQALGFLLGFWLVLAAAPWAAGASGADTEGVTSLEVELHRAVNRVRAERHLIPLERRSDLDAVARAHSRDMARRGYFAHQSPEGELAVHRLERAQVGAFTLAAENLGATNQAAPTRAIVSAWQASEVHRRNLHAPAFNATGIGVARAADGRLLYTQVYVTYPR